MKKQHVKTDNIINMVGIFGIFMMIGFVSTFAFSPVIKTNALYTPDYVEVGAHIPDIINLSLSDEYLELHASVNSFVHDSVTATVVTNSPYGYSLGIEDSDSDTGLRHVENTVIDVLTSDFLGAKTSSQMSDNTWGFSLDGTNYYRIPENGIPVRLKTRTGYTLDPDNTVVDFGAKVGMITSGWYLDEVVFSAYANGNNDLPTRYMIEPGREAYMQDFTSGDCENMLVNETINLKDVRDGNTYQIIKPSEHGLCIMKDNLKFYSSEPVNSETTNYREAVEFAMTLGTLNDFTIIDPSDTTRRNLAYRDGDGNVYYTWYTAKAGTTRTSASSICPDGWTLPFVDYDTNYLQHIYDNLLEVTDAAIALSRMQAIFSPNRYIVAGSGVVSDAGFRTWTDEEEINGDNAYAAEVSSGVQNISVNPNDGYLIRCMVVPGR